MTDKTVDMTPNIYGEAYGLTSNIVYNPEFNERVDEETKKYVQGRITQYGTDELVQYVLYRKVLTKIASSDNHDIDEEEINELQQKIVEEEDDERVRKALKGDGE